MKQIRSWLKTTAFVTATLSIYSTWWLSHFFVPEKNKRAWRQYILKLWARSFAAVSRMKLTVIGKPPKQPFFLVTNHLGYIDVPVLRLAADGVFVAKSDIESWPVAGRIIRDMGTIFIDRTNRRDIPRAGSEIIERLQNGEGVMVFPEGKGTNGESVLPFNSSFFEFAAKIDLPVYCATIHYRTPPGSPSASTMICWWEDISFVKHLRRMFTLPWFDATVTFTEQPILTSNRKELAARLHEKVLEHFVPIS